MTIFLFTKTSISIWSIQRILACGACCTRKLFPSSDQKNSCKLHDSLFLWMWDERLQFYWEDWDLSICSISQGHAHRVLHPISHSRAFIAALWQFQKHVWLVSSSICQVCSVKESPVCFSKWDDLSCLINISQYFNSKSNGLFYMHKEVCT